MTGPAPASAPAQPRTAEEIHARIEALRPNDIFGFAAEVLARALTFDDAAKLAVVADGCSREMWDNGRLVGDEIVRIAREYLRFAIEKIEGHQGISASRSVDKLTAFAWLMRRDDVVAAIDAVPYAQYGAPKVRAFAEGMGWGEDWRLAVANAPELARMAEGRPCEPDCVSGCGR